MFVPVIDGDFLPEPVAELRRKAPKVHAIIGKLVSIFDLFALAQPTSLLPGTTEFEALLFIAIGRRAQADMASFEKQLQVTIPDDCYHSRELREEARRLYLSKVDKKNKVEVAKGFMRVGVLKC